MADTYTHDPRAKTVEGFIAGLQILQKFMKDGMQTKFFCGGEHDIIHVYVDAEKLTAESDDGKQLVALGFHVEDDGWAYFT